MLPQVVERALAHRKLKRVPDSGLKLAAVLVLVYQKDGDFVQEAFVRPATLGSGSVSGVTLSTDVEQRWLFIPDGTNNVVWILDRLSLEVVEHFGRLGKNAGQFYRLHNLAIDSRGNLYTTEVNVGQRLQKFDRVGG